ncbi:unnamed protein product, partial [Dibothriocephalus latus]
IPTIRYCSIKKGHVRTKCCSSIGRQHTDKPQTISIAPSCETETTVIHELGHALGFWHEHSRPDQNIEPKYLHNFDMKDEVDSLDEPYDFNSIMNYHDGAAAKSYNSETVRPIECCPEIGGKSMPSKSDASQMNKLYKCPCKLYFALTANSSNLTSHICFFSLFLQLYYSVPVPYYSHICIDLQSIHIISRGDSQCIGLTQIRTQQNLYVIAPA